jgi:hypothetical protein
MGKAKGGQQLEDGVSEARKPTDLARLVRMVTEAQSLTAEARKQSQIDDDYYHSHQLTAAELKALAARGQPDIIINRTKAAINGILGVTEQGKSEPRAYPRTPHDEDSADVATDVLRYIAEKNRFPRLKQDVFRDMLVAGSGAVLIGANDDLDVTGEQIRWEELIYDPRARRADFADARFMGIAKWMYADDAGALYPDKRSAIEEGITNGGLIGDQTFQDRPENGQGSWIDKRQRRLMVVELYYRENGWKRCVFTASDILEEGDSPYTDDKGRPCNPIEAQSAYVDRNNNRYGAVRDMRGPQDEINKRRSKLLHLISTSQIQAVDPSAVEVNSDIARKEAARPDGVIPYGWQKVQTSDMATGQAQLLQEAKAELERLGPNPAILGRQGADSSGRALLARQQAGMVELAVLFGALEDWELRVYRQMWSRAKQFWKAPMFIRVTDDEDAPKFVALNQPQMGPPQLVAHPETGQPMIQPTILGYDNAMGEMDVDITLDSMPDTANIQQEQFQDLVQLVGSNPAYAAKVPFEVLLQLSAVPHKRQILDQLKQGNEQQAQQAAQLQAQQQQLALQGMQAEVAEKQTKAELNDANAHLAHARAHRESVSAATDTANTGHANKLITAQVAKTNADQGLSQVQAYDTLLNGIHQRQLAADAAMGQGPAAGDTGA